MWTCRDWIQVCLIPENLLSIFIFNHSVQLKLYFIQLKLVLYHLESHAAPYIPWNVHWPVKNTKEQRCVLCSTLSSRQNQGPKATTSLANVYLMNRKQWQGIVKYQIFPPREHNEQQTIGKVCQKGECNKRLWNLLRKFNHWTFCLGILTNTHFKRSKTSLKFPLKNIWSGFHTRARYWNDPIRC